MIRRRQMQGLYLSLALTMVLAGCEADAVTNVHVDIPVDTVEVILTDTLTLPQITDTLVVTDTLPVVVDTVIVTDTLPGTVDTVTVTVTDTLPPLPPDTVFVTDTLPPVPADTVVVVDTLPPVTDTLLVTDTLTVTDTLFVTDTVEVQRSVKSVVYELEGYVTDDSQKQVALGNYSVPAHEGPVEVWVQVELSGKHQKDEAFVLLKDGVPISDYACPVNPDNPTFGTDWIRVGTVNDGGQISAEHAKLWSCYPSNTGFQTPNSVWFKQLKFVYVEPR